MSASKVVYRDIAPGAAEAATITTDSANDFSALEVLVNNGESGKFATNELNQWLLDGSRNIHTSESVPFWSEELSGSDGAFVSAPQVVIQFPDAYASSGIMLMFDEDGLCPDVNLVWYKDGEEIASGDFAPDGTPFFCSKVVRAYDKLVITLKKTALPYRYARLTGIIFGVVRTFGMSELRDVRVTQELHPISLELPISTMTWTLNSPDGITYLFQEKQPVEAWTGERLLGVYYIDTAKRSSTNVYKMECNDAFGILDSVDFPGAVYTSKSAKEIVSSIVGDDFEIDFGATADKALTGAILPTTKREALQQVLFAWGVTAATDGGEKIRVFAPGTEPTSIGEDRTYTGASVTTEALVTGVTLTAHEYAEDTAGTQIGGKMYKDTQTAYAAKNSTITANVKPNEKSITDATLISPGIAQDTAARVLSYYDDRERANAKIVVGTETLGQCVTVPTPWGTTVTGNITKMEITLSNTVAADITLTGS